MKDVDPKDRDYEKTTRKYQSLVADQSLNSLISMVKFFLKNFKITNTKFSFKDRTTKTAKFRI